MTVDFYDEQVELGLPDGLLDVEEESSDPFLSKIGGRPTWLMTGVERPCCALCKSTMYLILQFDAPLPKTMSRGATIDRIFYVFACNSRVCTEADKPGAIKALVQCRITQNDNQKTSVTPAAPKGLWDSLMSDVTDSVKNVTLEESPSKQVKFHYDAEYPVGFPATALKIVEEFIAVHKKPAAKGANEDAEGVAMGGEGEVWQGEVYEQMQIAGYDKVFKAFHSRAAHYPRQCVRYSPEGTPLPFSADEFKVPVCECCGRECHFELQLMPAMLSMLPTNTDAHLKHIPKKQRGKHPLFGDGMEWGTIMVFSCGVCQLLDSSSSELTFEAPVITQIEKI